MNRNNITQLARAKFVSQSRSIKAGGYIEGNRT